MNKEFGAGGRPGLPSGRDLDPADDAVDLYNFPASFPREERELRAENLRLMLAASEQRQRAQRQRQPQLEPLSVGLKVRSRGRSLLVGTGIVLDTDYIRGQALVKPEGSEEVHWIAFTELSAA
ncbi:MAG: hypothetical protein CSB44_04180 [Gammaproteobacteria bacterium]|nr:MAG: hypothetical protein CSB44_04180 [Gammaproteobacteria bacterium]